MRRYRFARSVFRRRDASATFPPPRTARARSASARARPACRSASCRASSDRQRIESPHAAVERKHGAHVPARPRRRRRAGSPAAPRCSPARARCPATDSARAAPARPRVHFGARRPVRARCRAEKCATSAGRSSGRSRSGGTSIGITFSRKSRSSRNDPSATARVRSRLVALTIRTSTLIGLPPPTRSISFASIARSSFACASGAQVARPRRGTACRCARARTARSGGPSRR